MFKIIFAVACVADVYIAASIVRSILQGTAVANMAVQFFNKEWTL